MTRFATFHDLEGQSVFITGGGSGIGAALTEGFLEQGAKVAFVQRSDATAFVEELGARDGVRPLFMPCDVTDVAGAAGGHGAGGGGARADHRARSTTPPTTSATRSRAIRVEDWDRAQAINLRPHFFTAQAAVPGMKAAGGGSIINFSSISHMMGNARLLAYIAAKAASPG